MTHEYGPISVSIENLPVPPALPTTGHDSRALLADTINSLILMRFPLSLGDATAELNGLASLIIEANARIPDAVADAREQDHPWHDIATCLGISTRTARHRFTPSRARTRPHPRMDD